jgi:hypothetical protein
MKTSFFFSAKTNPPTKMSDKRGNDEKKGFFFDKFDQLLLRGHKLFTSGN